MRNFIKILLFLVGIFTANTSFSFQNTWAKDSLSYYEKIFWAEVKAKKIEEAKKTLYHIEDKGYQEVEPSYFDFYKSSLKRGKEIPSPEILGDLERALGTMEFYRGDIQASKSAFRKARAHYEKAKLSNRVAGMTMNLGIMQEKLGYFDSAILNYREALPIFEKDKDNPSLASVNENIGLAYIQLSENQKALDYLLKADSLLSTYLDSMDNRWVGLHLNKQIALSYLNRQDEGLNELLKGLRIAEHNKNETSIGKMHYKLAVVYQYKGEKEKEYKALLKAKYHLKKTQNLLDIANLNSALAMYHLGSSYLDSAVFYANECLSYFEPQGLTQEVGITYGTLGNVEFEKKNYEQAIAYFKKALEKFDKKESQDYAGFLFNIGFAYNKLGNRKVAMDYLERSLVIRKKLNIAVDLRESYQGLAEAYQRIGDYKNAFENLTLFQAYSDTVFNETKNKQLAEIETLYETEKKDKAISDLEQEKELQNLRADKQQAQIYLGAAGLVILLGVSGLFYRQATLRKKHNQELEIKNTEIAKQNAERELLLKEIHHRVKNNLQIISSLLSMQTRGLKDEKMKDAMKESQSRVKTMALIHEKLYQYENLSKINMQEYIQQLSDFLTQTYRSDKDIKITIDAADVNLDMDMAVPLGLITNELLSNSLKYAFENQDRGEITISFSQKVPGSYALLIKDSGKGLDENLDIENAKSLGLKLVKTLTRQINGQLKIVAQPGASFEIEFTEQALAA
jgi:two-component system, sensor histidine kinase PdtaS